MTKNARKIKVIASVTRRTCTCLQYHFNHFFHFFHENVLDMYVLKDLTLGTEKKFTKVKIGQRVLTRNIAQTHRESTKP